MAGDDALTYQAETGQEKIDFLQNPDIVLDSNSIEYSLGKDEPSFAGQISYSPTPFPNTPITSNNFLLIGIRDFYQYILPDYQDQSPVYQSHGFSSSGNFIHFK